MKKLAFIGIDISKKTLDVCVKIDQSINHCQISNHTKAIHKLMDKYMKQYDVIIGMENTGRYNWPLYEALSELTARVFVLSALHLKKSLGLVRGKNDRIDAQRIMQYVEKNWMDLQAWEAPSKTLQKLKILLTERNSRVKMIKQLKAVNKEYDMISQIAKEERLAQMNNKLIKDIEKQVAAIEKKIDTLLASCDQLHQQQQRLLSVPGIGRILSWYLIAKTDNFKIINNPRKLACYCGVVPFEHRSGTSIRGKTRVSIHADHKLKSLLHLGAMSAIRLDNDLQEYYIRKVNEGKSKMSVLNAVRNKIIHRAFAVVKQEKMYEKNLAAA